MFARSTLGSPATGVKITNFAATGATAAVGGAAAAGLISASAAGPIGAGIALAALAITALIANSGCGPTCIAASNLVNELEPQFRANRDAYLASPRTPADKAAALANFDYGFAGMSKALSDPALGDAGKRGISDRSRGGKWDWYAYYRDPIEQAPMAEADPISQAAATFLGTEPSPALLIAAGLLLVGVLL